MSRALLVVNARPWSGAPLAADAVLVRDGAIEAVGRAAELRAAAAEVRVLDARGGTVTPGITDAHLHLVPWARARRQPDLHGAPTCADALGVVARALADLPPGDAPLVGRGWDETGWEAAPHRDALDALAPRRPVVLHRHDFHALWVNSAALRAAGVTPATPDPDGGVFERDAGGELTGVVREHAVRAFAALEDRAAPALDDALLDDAAAALHAVGVTAVHDYQREAGDRALMRALAGRRRLRVLQMVGLDAVRAAGALGLASGAGDDWFRIGGLKLFADGTLGSRTAAMLAPYEDRGGLGMALIPPAELRELVGEAAAAGFPITVHAIGDAAVRATLDAVEAHHALVAALPAPPRVEHVQLLDPADRTRFRRLGVVASMQPQHATTDAVVARTAWGARCVNAYPWRDLLAEGVVLAFGSDAPVEPPVPALGLAAAVGRVGGDGQPFTPAQRLALDDALVAYTRGAALAAGERFGPGTLTPGAPGDLVVWDRDLHAADLAALAAAAPRFTTLAGRIVYESPERAVPSGPSSGEGA